jgi:hypothetical protein
MNIEDNTAHERKVECTVPQKEMFRLIAEHVAKEAKFDLDAPTGVRARVYISESNRGSIAGSIERNVRVELTQDLLPTAGPSRYEFT